MELQMIRHCIRTSDHFGPCEYTDFDPPPPFWSEQSRCNRPVDREGDERDVKSDTPPIPAWIHEALPRGEVRQ